MMEALVSRKPGEREGGFRRTLNFPLRFGLDGFRHDPALGSLEGGTRTYPLEPRRDNAPIGQLDWGGRK